MKGLRTITPYIPGEQPSDPTMIKLNTNENPYPPSKNVERRLKAFETGQLKRYSSVDNAALKKALAIKHDLKPENFLIGNGSDEVLAFCFLAFFNSSDPILFPDITYGFYKIWADLFKIPFKEIALGENFDINLTEYSQLINGGILIANPNAPTGMYKPLSDIKQVLQQNQDVIVIVDEAYIDFGGTSAVKLLDEFPNVIIIRTFSKSSSLAGLRVGYAIGNPEYIKIAESIKASFNPYSVDSIAETLAIAAVEDPEYYVHITQKICATRDWFSEELKTLGFQFLPSKTNFLLVSHPSLEIKELYNYLSSHNVYVRYFPKIARLENYLRITIGTQADMETVVGLFKTFADHV